MTRIALIFAIIASITTAAGCIAGSRQGERDAEAELTEEAEAAIAACRCGFETDVEKFDVPCGTTYCIGETAVQCNLDAQVVELGQVCLGYGSHRLITGVCLTDYPGEYPIDCEAIAGLDECESHGGCFIQDAPCRDADFGCEAFVTPKDEE